MQRGAGYFQLHLNKCLLDYKCNAFAGYGQAALQSLPGHIGRHDVDDCMAALAAAADAGALLACSTTLMYLACTNYLEIQKSG
jgi:hypothetical protein